MLYSQKVNKNMYRADIMLNNTWV